MFRKAWLIASLAVAIIISLLIFGIFPDLLAVFLPARVPQGVIEILARSAMSATAIYSACTAFFFTLLGFGGLAFFDSIAGRKARRNLEPLIAEHRAGHPLSRRDFTVAMEDVGDLSLLAEQYADSFSAAQSVQGDTKVERVFASIPAGRFFGPDITVEKNLLAWLFRLLAWSLVALGVVLLAAAFAIGIDNTIFGSEVQQQSRMTSGFLLPVEAGVVSLLIALVGALLTGLFIKVVASLRRGQSELLARDLDLLFYAQASGPGIGGGAAQDRIEAALAKTNERLKDLDKIIVNAARHSAEALADGIEEALEAPMSKLAAGIDSLSAEQSGRVAQLIEQSLAGFSERLAQDYQDQLKTLGETLNAVAQSAQALEKIGDTASAAALKQLAENSKGLNKSLEGALKAVKDIGPLLKESAEHQHVIRKHLESDSSTSKHLQKASADMAAAATAGRDTVERFIALAERLREVSKNMTGGGPAMAASAAVGTAPAPDPETAKRLSQALKELRRLSTLDHDVA